MCGICTRESDVGTGKVWADRGLGSMAEGMDLGTTALAGSVADVCSVPCPCLEGAVLDRYRDKVGFSIVGSKQEVRG